MKILGQQPLPIFFSVQEISLGLFLHMYGWGAICGFSCEEFGQERGDMGLTTRLVNTNYSLIFGLISDVTNAPNSSWVKGRNPGIHVVYVESLINTYFNLILCCNLWLRSQTDSCNCWALWNSLECTGFLVLFLLCKMLSCKMLSTKL